MATKIEVEELLRGLLAEFRDVVIAKREITEEIHSNSSAITREIRQRSDRIDQLNAEIDSLQVDLHEASPRLSEDLAACERREAELHNSIKQAAYTIDPEEAGGGTRIESDGGWRIAVSKVRTKISYKTDDLLRDFPWLADKDVDGDPLIVKSIDSSILSRLCATGEIDSSELSSYRVVTKEKNPSVRISVGGENE